MIFGEKYRKGKVFSKMTFEEILPVLKKGEKAVRANWSSAEKFVKIYDSIELRTGEKLSMTPYFLIYVQGTGEGYSMWSPTPCDVLADDWQLVD